MMSKQKGKEVEKFSKEKYNVTYLGWKECRGLYGVENTNPVIHEMIYGLRPDNFNFEQLPRLVMTVSRKELKMTQTISKKPGKLDTMKFHTVQMRDLMFASKGESPDDSVVACLYLGYNKSTKLWTHVHAYMCENSLEADKLIKHLYQYINTPYHRDRLVKIERDLVKKGHVKPHVKEINSPYDEMGFPLQYEKSSIQNPSEPSYSIYGTAEAYSIYGTAESLSTTQKKVGEGLDDGGVSSMFEKYRVQEDLMGAPLKLPRVSTTTSEGIYGGVKTSVQEATLNGFLPSSEPYPGSSRINPNDNRLSVGGAKEDMTDGQNGYKNKSTENLSGKYSAGAGSVAYGGLYGSRPNEFSSVYASKQPASQLELEAGPPDYDYRDPVESALAAELKTKLGKGGPLLLPPKDYDTVSRTHGNLIGIEERKSKNEKVVGKVESASKFGQFEWNNKSRGGY